LRRGFVSFLHGLQKEKEMKSLKQRAALVVGALVSPDASALGALAEVSVYHRTEGRPGNEHQVVLGSRVLSPGPDPA
jgi:hypothetical protein